MKLLFSILILIIVIGIFSTGCVPSKPTEEIEYLPSERLINKLEANRRKIKNFEGVGTISIESEHYDNSASFRVIMQKPDSIYFTIMGPFGIELAQALVTQNDFIFYDALENTAYIGLVTDDVLYNIFKVNLTFNDLIDAFVGSVNLTKNLYKQPKKYEIEYDRYILTYDDPERNSASTYRVDVRELGITDYSLASLDGTVSLEGRYSNFEIIESVAIPFTIEVENKIDKQKVKITYRDIVTNQKGINIDFVLPDDASVISW